MVTPRVLKLAVLISTIVTGIVVPLSMLVASAPTGDDAAAGFADLDPTGAEILVAGLGVVGFFVGVCLIAALVIGRLAADPCTVRVEGFEALGRDPVHLRRT